MTPQSVDQIAAESKLPRGRVLYLLQRPGAPRPVERTSRERLYNPTEVAAYFKTWGRRC